MAENRGERIRVVLRWVQILDNMEPFWQEKGEFRFRSKISSDNFGGVLHETRFPETGTWSISSNPAWNKEKLDRPLFEGEIEDHLVIELFGEEVDRFGKNDQLDHYRREFRGSVDEIVGRYGPGPDTPQDDPTVDLEKMEHWGVCYDIERA